MKYDTMNRGECDESYDFLVILKNPNYIQTKQSLKIEKGEH